MKAITTLIGILLAGSIIGQTFMPKEFVEFAKADFPKQQLQDMGFVKSQDTIDIEGDTIPVEKWVIHDTVQVGRRIHHMPVSVFFSEDGRKFLLNYSMRIRPNRKTPLHIVYKKFIGQRLRNMSTLEGNELTLIGKRKGFLFTMHNAGMNDKDHAYIEVEPLK